MNHLNTRALYLTLLSLITVSFNNLMAQCNVNDKYDKIISGYHSSIALKDNGTYAVWGSSMQNNGSSDQLSPQDINSTNYPALTGTIYKAALGGKSANATVDQGILLTSDGLWAWGVTGNVLKSTIKSNSTFGRITSPSGGVGSTTLGLPTGVAPTDVQSLFATYQTLVLLTKIVNNVGGDVYILTQTSQAIEANGQTAGTAGNSCWQKVKISAGTYLTNVTSVRGQVNTSSLNAFVALTSNGNVYTWGNGTYLGNGSTATARNYATLMTLPAEFSSTNIPKMIAVTGGGGSGATTVKNTYYILSNSGAMYSLGDNSQKQCGDFTTATEKTNWVNVKSNSTTNFSNINFFSCQEHNASFPSVVAITTNGTLYTWGNNSSGMLGRTDNGAAGGGLSTVSFDPGTVVGFSGTAISAEMGGHTMVYTKEASNQFCYVGHYTNGSMGDGTSGNNGTSSATSLKHDCSSTPNISICGYVPIAASAVNSTITAADPVIAANGTSSTLITVRLKDASNNNLSSSGGNVNITASDGTLSSVIDNNNGTYNSTLTSSSTPGDVSLHFTINGVAANSSASVNFASTLSLSWVNVYAYRQKKEVIIGWTSTNEVNTSDFDIERSLNGRDWNIIISNIPAVNNSGDHAYKQTDNNYNPDQLYYRIKQKDQNGRYSYSNIVIVPSVTYANTINVFPVPAHSNFQLGNINPADIKLVQLYSMNGTRIRTWSGFKSSYDIENISKGIYMLRVETISGKVEILRVKKI